MINVNKLIKNQKFKVNMHITEKCNYNCRYCFADFGTGGKTLSLEDNKRIVDNLIDSGIVEEISRDITITKKAPNRCLLYERRL